MNGFILTEFYNIRDILNNFPEAIFKTFTDVNFSYAHNVIFGIILTLLSFLIYIRANIIYSATLDRRIILLGIGIGFAGLFELLHFINSYDKSLMFYYIFFENFANTFSFLLPLFFMTNPYSEKDNKFRTKVFFYYLMFFLFVLSFQTLLKEEYLNKIFTYSSFEIIYSALFFLFAMIYITIRMENKLRLFSFFVLGIIFLALSELYVPIGGYFTSIYRYWVHILNLFSLIFILIGIKDIQINAKIISLRQKFILYPSLLIIILYMCLIILSSTFLSFKIPAIIDYFFLSFFIITVISLYLLAKKLTYPIEKVTEGIKNFNPDQKPEELKMFSNDELGELTDEFNKNTLIIWKNQNDLKKYAEREIFIKEIIQATTQSLDLDELLRIIAKELSEKFNVQRVSVNKFLYDENHSFSGWQLMYEFRSRPDVKSVADLPYYKEETDILAKILIGKGIFYIENIDTFKIGAPAAYIANFETLKIKSLILVSIGRGTATWGSFGMSDVDKFRTWDKETIDLLFTLSDQIYIAIKQAELYSQIKKQAEREKLISNIISTIRTSLDINEVKEKIVSELGKVVNADRCFILEHNSNTGHCYPVKNEYLASADDKSIIGIDVEKENPQIINLITKGEIVKGSVDEILKEHNLYNTSVENYFKNYEIKKGIGLPIFYANQLLGTLIIHFTKEGKTLSNEDLQLTEILTDQIGIVLYQAKLFESVKFNAEKERILKELIGKIKTSHKVDEVFETLFSDIFKLYDINRAIFIEIPPYKYQKPLIKAEHSVNIKYLSEIADYNSNLNSLLDILCVNEKLIINELDLYKDKNHHWKEFTEDYSIKSIISVPLISHKESIELIGVIALFSEKTTDWTNEAINLLEGIANTIVGMIWDIKKKEEIDELKINLVLTLATKLQEPLVKKKKILNFLINQEDLVNYQGILEESLDMNNNMTNTLAKLIDIYNYESNKHLLMLKKGDINNLLNKTLDLFKEKINQKSLNIELQEDRNLPETLFEEQELCKVIYCFLDNAFTFIQEKGTVIIKSYQENEKIIICIIDNGPGISDNFKDLIFERQLATILSSKETGTGLGLYLSKLIIQAHKGETWFYSEKNSGSTFCFSLPIQ